MQRIIFLILAIIPGVSAYWIFNFQTMKFANTGLAIVYLTAAIASVFFLLKSTKPPQRTEN
ncbi:hypothetical protein ACFP1I_30685 [Dyadobacter subterraneus]|uniref:Uncharacterized protein n=1 Tax=Dyadobacter subterraneus TaxID=2773304 RepID=A0ABR9W896_9BACT|nr:hypothetical protein [Dyadobacter subterraneus]MBE9461684.1 hypothetical protein [Dyadobacter subterraneus]